MSLLATIKTALGKIELHHESGRFTTRRVVRGVESEVLSGHRSYVSTILIDRERAAEWYALAEGGNSVHQPFPQPEAAAPERNTA